jgi:hypothetical protein
MPIVTFMLRTPGNHRAVEEVDLPFVPREGEYVTLPGESAGRRVHDVGYVLEPPRAIVLLRDD